jgi:phage repressor protein C with HTH and peptisase S24 domain
MSGFGIFGRVKVEGASMQPTYNPQDWLLVYYGLLGKKQLHLSSGDVVVIEREQQPGIFYIKRITEIKKENAGQVTYYVRSDNESGTDSRTWGYLSSGEVVGKVITRIKKA